MNEISERFAAAEKIGDVGAMRAARMEYCNEQNGFREVYKRSCDSIREYLKEKGGNVRALRYILARSLWVDKLELMASQIHKRRIDALEQRLAELEQRKSFEYCGVWSEDSAYARNDFVTHDGSLWHCNRETRARPGTSEEWQLAVKRGRNSR